MSKKNKKKLESDSQDYLFLPKLNLGDKARRSLVFIILILLSLIIFLGLFDLAGTFGAFITKYLALALGVGKWLLPIILIYWAILRIKKDRPAWQFSTYLGIFLLFISYQSLFHLFLDSEKWLETAKLGQGGGYLGYYLSKLFFSILDFWGALVLIIALLFVALVILFNTSLNKIIGRESFLFIILKPFSSFFKILFRSKSDEDEEMEEDDTSEEDLDESEYKTVAPGKWQEKSLSQVDLKEEELIGGEEAMPNLKEILSSYKKAKNLKQEKMVWPKNLVKIDLPLELLDSKASRAIGGDTDLNAKKIKNTLDKFGIEVEMGDTKVGPTVTQYTFRPAEGIKLSRITTLNNDLSLALAAHPIRIEAPIPGQSLVGVEVPNKSKAIVGLKEILSDDSFKNRKNNLQVVLGKDVAGTSWTYDLTKMPHLLVAGATNSGKSVCLNSIIVGLLYQNNPDNLRFIMVDPKRVELPVYNGIPHLLTPVITEVSKTINSLRWCLNEMDRRYDLLNKAGKKNIQTYNQVAKEKLPYIVFIIDELADFMMTSGKEMEAAIIRIAQMSRAIGIHLILATQRPSVDVITGLIKANISARIAFSVASLVDSKTILDSSGAEKLLGQGDMLFTTAELSKPKRIQGAFLSEEEINNVINYIKEKGGAPEYLEGVTERQKVSGTAGVGLDGTYGDEDELLEEAKSIIIKAGKASTSMLQRRLSIGYGRAAKILDFLEEAGIIGPSDGPRPREVLISQEEYEASATSAMPIHNRFEQSAPGSYLSKEDLEDEEPGDSLDLSRDDDSVDNDFDDESFDDNNSNNDSNNDSNTNFNEEEDEQEDEGEEIKDTDFSSDEKKVNPEEAENEMFFSY